MKKNTKKILCLLCGLMLAACGGPMPSASSQGEGTPVSSPAPAETKPEEPATKGMTMEALLNLVNERHKAVQKPVIDFTQYIHDAPEDDFNISAYGEERSFDPAAPLTPEQAGEDVEILFRALETTYGPYYVFGGDEAFGKAKADVLADCGKQTELTAEFLAGSLVKHLSFLRDFHFNINGQRLSQPHIPYLYTGTAFRKTDDGYQSADGKDVESVDGYDQLDELFQMSLSEAGEVVWYPVVLTERPEDRQTYPPDLTVHYTDGSTERLATGPWSSYYDESDRVVELYENQGIPVLFARNMGFDEAKDDELGRAFLAYAKQLRDEPVVIIDLRSNGGGNSLLPLKWYQDYAGAFVPTNCQGLQYWTEEDLKEYCADTDNPYYASYETFTELAGETPVSDAYMKELAQPDAFVKNDRLLILLTGKNTASAAETFIDIARNLENTLVIGQNTGGMLTSNAYTVMYLPHSGIAVQLGNSLTLFPEGDFQEFVGYRPDLWVSGDAEEAAVRFVKNMTR